MSKRNENLVVKTTALALCNNPWLKNICEQDVLTKEKKSLPNLKQRKSATWCKTTGILWNPLPLPFAQSASPINVSSAQVSFTHSSWCKCGVTL